MSGFFFGTRKRRCMFFQKPDVREMEQCLLYSINLIITEIHSVKPVHLVRNQFCSESENLPLCLGPRMGYIQKYELTLYNFIPLSVIFPFSQNVGSCTGSVSSAFQIKAKNVGAFFRISKIFQHL